MLTSLRKVPFRLVLLTTRLVAAAARPILTTSSAATGTSGRVPEGILAVSRADVTGRPAAHETLLGRVAKVIVETATVVGHMPGDGPQVLVPPGPVPATFHGTRPVTARPPVAAAAEDGATGTRPCGAVRLLARRAVVAITIADVANVVADAMALLVAGPLLAVRRAMVGLGTGDVAPAPVPGVTPNVARLATVTEATVPTRRLGFSLSYTSCCKTYFSGSASRGHSR